MRVFFGAGRAGRFARFDPAYRGAGAGSTRGRRGMAQPEPAARARAPPEPEAQARATRPLAGASGSFVPLLAPRAHSRIFRRWGNSQAFAAPARKSYACRETFRLLATP